MNNDVYLMLQNWKDADNLGPKSNINKEVKQRVHIEFGKDALHSEIKQIVYLKSN